MTSTSSLETCPTASKLLPYRVALVGNPNTGKSTLFNSLAGLNVRTGNYPGVTIEKKVGRCRFSDSTGNEFRFDLIDLPGTYSLAPRSPDEMVAVKVLTDDQQAEPPIDLIVCVVNASMLRRNLFLVSQLIELGKPLIVVLNMMDTADIRGLQIDSQQLSKSLGVPIIETSASKQIGIARLQTCIADVAADRSRAIPAQTQVLSPMFSSAVDRLSSSLSTDLPSIHKTELPSRFLLQRAIIDQGGTAETILKNQYGVPFEKKLGEVRHWLLTNLLGEKDIQADLIDVECEERYAWSEKSLEGVLGKDIAGGPTWSERMDAVLSHRILGLIAFLAIMFVVFQFIYSFASIPMDVIDVSTGWLADGIHGMMGPGMLRSLLVDGVIAGVGGVLIFLPQIALLFFFLAILEDCGYMARAAFVVDRMMAIFGLSGKSFLPLMSSFACAVPGIMAARVIESPRDRIVTIMIAPLMSCSARLPVYLLLIGAFVPTTAWLGGWLSLSGIVLMGMYFVGVVVAIPVAILLKLTLLRGEPAPFVMEMPDYKWPSLRVVLARVWEASAEFVVRAGTLIFAASILIWFTGYWPGDHARHHELETKLETLQPDSTDFVLTQQQLHQEQARLLENSLLGQTGHAIEPIVRPLGWDWKIGVGVIASFPAREVIIATLGTIYSLGGEEDEEGLIGAMRASTHPDGTPVFNLPVALSVMVFFALCAQCVSTLLVIHRETHSWFWPILSFTYMTVLAYIGSWATYQASSYFFT